MDKFIKKRRQAFFGDMPITELTLKKVPLSCDGCGACCQHMGYPPFMVKFYDRDNPEPWDEYPEDFDWFMSAPPEAREQMIDGLYDHRGDKGLPCVWLDPETKKCAHYESRPGICRDFEMDSDACHNHRRLLEIE